MGQRSGRATNLGFGFFKLELVRRDRWPDVERHGCFWVVCTAGQAAVHIFRARVACAVVWRRGKG